MFEHGPSSAAPHAIFGEAGAHILGHEFAGVVTAIAPGVTGLSIGDAVAVRPNVWDGTCPACGRGNPNLCESGGFIGINGGGGGFSEHVVVDRSAVHVLPGDVGTQRGALIESMAVAWHAVSRSNLRRGDTALIVGAGPIGLSVLLCLRAQGAARVIVSEPSTARRQRAADLGAETIDPRDGDLISTLIDMTSGGADISFDASGYSAETFTAAYRSLRSGGHMVVVARVHDQISFDVGDFLFSERTVTGSYSYTDEDFAEVTDAVLRGVLDPLPLVSRVIPLESLVSAGLEHLLGDGRESEVKILVGLNVTKSGPLMKGRQHDEV
jgi:threonine dehydrogenase-like Zn-dependent dehydrogenase